MAYQQAATDLGRSPANMEEFRPFLSSYGAPEALTTTPTGQPIEIVWNARTKGARRGAMPVIAVAPDEDATYTAIDFQLAFVQLSDKQVADLIP